MFHSLIKLLSSCRQASVNLTADNSPYNITVLMRFTVAEHHNNTFVFEAASSPVWLILSGKILLYVSTVSIVRILYI